MLKELASVELHGKKSLTTWYDGHFSIVRSEFLSDWSDHELTFFQCLKDCEIEKHKIKKNEVIAYKVDGSSFNWYRVDNKQQISIEKCFDACYEELEKSYRQFMDDKFLEDVLMKNYCHN
ncbi:MAG: hypothetical protein HRT88_05225 [Lentisphaeraceae bacterium]|nr:hypothetical protein [Lentisphaeraceae bacterium]